jgi:hypothetical protein
VVMNKEVISHVGNNRTQYNSVSNGCLRCPSMDSFEELCKALAERIDKSETRQRGRTAEAKQHYSVKRLCFSLRTKSHSQAMRTALSVHQRL